MATDSFLVHIYDNDARSLSMLTQTRSRALASSKTLETASQKKTGSTTWIARRPQRCTCT